MGGACLTQGFLFNIKCIFLRSLVPVISIIFNLLSFDDRARFSCRQFGLVCWYHKYELTSISFFNEIHRPGQLAGHNQGDLEVDCNSCVLFPFQNSADIFFNTNLLKGFSLLRSSAIFLVTHLEDNSAFVDDRIASLTFVLLVYFDINTGLVVDTRHASLKQIDDNLQEYVLAGSNLFWHLLPLGYLHIGVLVVGVSLSSLHGRLECLSDIKSTKRAFENSLADLKHLFKVPDCEQNSLDLVQRVISKGRVKLLQVHRGGVGGLLDNLDYFLSKFIKVLLHIHHLL